MQSRILIDKAIQDASRLIALSTPSLLPLQRKGIYPNLAQTVAAFELSVAIPDLTDALSSLALPKESSESLNALFLSGAHRLRSSSCAALRDTLSRSALHTYPCHARISQEASQQNLLAVFRSTVDKQILLWRIDFLRKLKSRCAVCKLADAPPICCVPDSKLTFNHDFTPILMNYFSGNAYPFAQERDALARTSGMSLEQITNWFQNHRNRSKKEGGAVKRLDRNAARKFHASMLRQMSTFENALERSDSEDSQHEVSYEADDEPPTTVPFLCEKVPAHAFPTVYQHRSQHDQVFVARGPLPWMRKPVKSIAPTRVSVDFDDLCDRFRLLTVNTETSDDHIAASTWFPLTPLSNGRHPAFVPINQRHLHKPYSSPVALASTAMSRKKPSLARRVPGSGGVQSPSRTPARWSSISSVETSSSTTSSISSHSCSSSGNYSSSDEGPATPVQSIATSLPIIAGTDFNFDISFGNIADSINWEELFNDSEQLDAILGTIMADDKQSFDFGGAPACNSQDMLFGTGFPPTGFDFASIVAPVT